MKLINRAKKIKYTTSLEEIQEGYLDPRYQLDVCCEDGTHKRLPMDVLYFNATETFEETDWLLSIESELSNQFKKPDAFFTIFQDKDAVYDVKFSDIRVEHEDNFPFWTMFSCWLEAIAKEFHFPYVKLYGKADHMILHALNISPKFSDIGSFHESFPYGYYHSVDAHCYEVMHGYIHKSVDGLI